LPPCTKAGTKKQIRNNLTPSGIHNECREKYFDRALIFSAVREFHRPTPPGHPRYALCNLISVTSNYPAPDEDPMPHFVRDIQEIRQRAIHKMEDGAVTESYKGDVNKTIEILNEALATEIVCVLRYMHHYFMATGVHAKSVADEFKEHADDEREHADSLAERIQQLGGKPNFDPKGLLERSISQYVEGETLAEMIREDLVAERMVIEVYHEMVRYFGANDPTTRILMEELLKKEEEHASDLSDLLYIANPETGQSEGEDPGTDPLKLDASGKTRERTDEELKQGRSKKPAA
jgi:bacterioferritin